MQEIKYRAWFHKTTPTSNGDFMMYSSTILNDVKLWDMEPGKRTRVIQSIPYKSHVKSQWTDFWDNVRSFFGKVTIMEYTGLHDCKRTEEYPDGQEIFEGDIVRRTCDLIGSDHSDFIGIVRQECAMFLLESFNGKDGRDLWDDVQELEVMGNIYQNPEMLEDTNEAK